MDRRGGQPRGQGLALAHQGEAAAARAAADAALEAGAELGGRFRGIGATRRRAAALAAGDVAAAHEAREAARQHMSVLRGGRRHVQRICNAEAALADGDLVAARRWADEAVATATGWYLVGALTTRARVAIAQGEPEQAERDAHDALAMRRQHRGVPGSSRTSSNASPLWPATAAVTAKPPGCSARQSAIRQRMGAVRFKIYDAGYEASVAALRDAMGEKDFEAAWAEGAALSTEEAIAYAQRGRGQRKRPASGWASLTPTERDVVRLVSEGLGNNDIAARLFVSPRTVQTHLTHVYTKLGLSSRVQLAQEAARHD